MTHEERKQANEWLSANASTMPPEICRTLRMALMDSDVAAEHKGEADSIILDESPNTAAPSVKPGRVIRFVCWFSRKFFDIHDYYESRGGDGIPTHFYIYTCWHCGRRFQI